MNVGKIVMKITLSKLTSYEVYHVTIKSSYVTISKKYRQQDYTAADSNRNTIVLVCYQQVWYIGVQHKAKAMLGYTYIESIHQTITLNLE